MSDAHLNTSLDVYGKLARHAEKTVIVTEGFYSGRQVPEKPISVGALCDMLECAAPWMKAPVPPRFVHIKWQTMEAFVHWITGGIRIDRKLLVAICTTLRRGKNTPIELVALLRDETLHPVPHFHYFLESWSIREVDVNEAISRLRWWCPSNKLYLSTESAYHYNLPAHNNGRVALVTIANPDEKEVLLIRVHHVNATVYDRLIGAVADYGGKVYSYSSIGIPNLKTIKLQRNRMSLISAAKAKDITIRKDETLSNWSRNTLRVSQRMYAATEAVVLTMLA